MRPTQRCAVIPARFAHIAFYMAGIMAFLMSIILVWINTGWDDGFFDRVLHSYVITMPIAGCCVIMVQPLVQKLINFTVKSQDRP